MKSWRKPSHCIVCVKASGSPWLPRFDNHRGGLLVRIRQLRQHVSHCWAVKGRRSHSLSVGFQRADRWGHAWLLSLCTLSRSHTQKPSVPRSWFQTWVLGGNVGLWWSWRGAGLPMVGSQPPPVPAGRLSGGCDQDSFTCQWSLPRLHVKLSCSFQSKKVHTKHWI